MGRAIVFFLSVCCFNCCCYGKIVESKEMMHTLSHAIDNSLYVFDLDNTLIEPHQHLGSDQWVSYEVEHLIQQGLTQQEALDQVIPLWMQIHEKTEMKLVDPSIPDLLHQLRKKQIACIGLTKREPRISNRTLDQLDRLHITFQPLFSVDKEYTFDHLKGTLYKRGVIFVASGMNKGPSLLAYLKKVQKMPSQIVVIDDKMSHLQDIETALKPLGIPFVGVRFGAVDEKVKAFNPQIADVQMEYLHKILSDEEALHLLKMKQSE